MTDLYYFPSGRPDFVRQLNPDDFRKDFITGRISTFPGRLALTPQQPKRIGNRESWYHWMI